MRFGKPFALSLVVGSMIITACTTQPDHKKVMREPVAATPKKPVKPAPVPADIEDEAEHEAKAEKISLRSVVSMVYHLSDSKQQPNEQETKIIAQLKPNPKSGSIEEAALAVVALRESVPMASNTTVVEQEVLGDNRATKPAATTGSIEDRMKTHGVDLPTALNENPLLRSFAVYSLANEAVQHSADSDEYKGKVTAVLSSEAGMWAALQNQKKETAPVEAVAVKPAAPEKPAQGVFSAGDMRRGDVLLAEAQRLADKGEFKKALERVSQINNNDPLFGAAKERTRFFSNLAVQDLRQKAAQAFQAALPLTETESKAGYLERARQFLDDAIKNYPESDQLQTVKDNLAVIVKDLQSLGKAPQDAGAPQAQ